MALLDRVDRQIETRMMDSLENAARTADRFAGDRLLEGDIDRFLAWALGLHRQGRKDEALDTLRKTAERAQRPDERIPVMIEWIATRGTGRDPEAVLCLVRVYLVMDNIENAILNLPDLLDADEEILQQAVSVVEKDLVPRDFGKRSRVYLGRLLAAAGRIEEACQVLEKLLEEEELGADVNKAMRELVERAPDSPRPQLLQARLKKHRGETTAAMDALKAAFRAGGESSGQLMEVARDFLENDLDRDDEIAHMLADHLTSEGSVSDAVQALIRLVETDTEWVTAKLQELLKRDKNNAETLSLLSIAMLIEGREAQAEAAIRHLLKRRDTKSRQDILQVLNHFDGLMESHPRLRKVRARIRADSGNQGSAALDWMELLLSGGDVPDSGLIQILDEDLPERMADRIAESDFDPTGPLESMIAGIAAVSRGDYTRAGHWLAVAAQDPALAERAAEQVAVLPDEALKTIDLEEILPLFTKGGAARHAADILMRTEGDAPWRLSLIPRLRWGDPPRELLFRLRAYIREGRVALAGSAADDLDVEDRSLTSLVAGCAHLAAGRGPGATEELDAAVRDRRTSSLARSVVREGMDSGVLSRESGSLLLARSHETEGDTENLAESLRVVAESDEVVEELRRVVEENPAAPEPLSLLVDTLAARGEVDELLKRAPALLDVKPELAQHVMDLAERLGREKGNGRLLAYAAGLSDAHHLSRDPEALLVEAVLAEPETASSLMNRKGAGPAFRALCALAAGDAATFSGILRRREGLELPMSESIVDTAMKRWRPGKDDEALSILADKALEAGYRKRAEAILSEMAGKGIGAWKTRAAEHLLEKALEGDISRRAFWASVRDAEAVRSGISKGLAADLADADHETVSAMLAAVTNSSLHPRELLDFAASLMKTGRDDVRQGLRQIAEVCYEATQSGRGAAEIDLRRLIDLLLEVEMVPQASRLAMSAGDDGVLERVRESLARHRKAQAGRGEDGAEALLLAGDAGGALEALGERSVEDGARAEDLRARALWRLGRRDTARGVWLSAYRRTGDPLLLARLAWALESGGRSLESRAVSRLLAKNHPEMAPRPFRRPAGGLDTIST
jgi:tetratricopeptide (TPR) repeat protein